VITNGGAAWYLRSMSDNDTHYGSWSGVSRSVHALCGVEFQPVRLPYGGTFLPGMPPDPDQICPACRSKARGPADGV
jgi:hypothetical protein